MIYWTPQDFIGIEKSPNSCQSLILKCKKINVFGPDAMELYCEIKTKIEDLPLIGNNPRKLSCFGKLYLE